IFDECHHLPTDFYRVIAEYSLAPYRLGLTATPERSDGRHSDLSLLIGSTVYRKTPEDLAGSALANHRVVQILVKLSPKERETYQEQMKVRNEFIKENNIKLSSLEGWKQFVMLSARSPVGRRAMLAHRQAKEISLCTNGKLRILADLLSQHHLEKTLIFTADNSTVYKISQSFLIPAITHQTPVKERHEILTKFRAGDYKTLVASHVLNEGVDVPDAKIAIILSGTGSEREYIQRLGRVLRKGNTPNKQAILYEVVTEDTSEERTSQRRKGETSSKPQPPKKSSNSDYQQLDIFQPKPLYGMQNTPSKRVAESSEIWNNQEESE
ncbi:MAG: DEAD/DEAH box helicase, partial [Planktothrix sp.]